ncbi:MAG: hypothetical protein AAF591_19700 [Verrucomicrobiota bacterium]
MNTNDSPETNPTSRREFFTRGAQAAALLTVGGHATITTGATAKASPTRKSLLPIKIDAHQVRDIATGPNDQIYVAADATIRIYDRLGAPLKTITLHSPPQCLAVQADGRIVAGLKNHLEFFNADGTAASTSPTLPDHPNLTAIHLGQKNDYFVSDSGNNLIWHLDATGNVIDKIDRDGKGFAVPKNFFPISVDAQGKIAAVNVARHRVETLDAHGHTTGAWGEKSRDLEGFGGCCNPVAIAHTASGQVVTAEAGLPRIKIFSPDGAFKELVAGPESFETNARESRERPEQPDACHTGGFELAVDSKDRILVLDRVTAEILIFA